MGGLLRESDEGKKGEKKKRRRRGDQDWEKRAGRKSGEKKEIRKESTGKIGKRKVAGERFYYNEGKEE